MGIAGSNLRKKKKKQQRNEEKITEKTTEQVEEEEEDSSSTRSPSDRKLWTSEVIKVEDNNNEIKNRARRSFEDDFTHQTQGVKEERIERYEIVSKLGQGTFGDVFLVRENTKLYALKKISCKNIKEAQNAIKEAGILKNLSHPNVVYYKDLVPIYDNGNAFMCLVMEYVEGCTLSQFLQQNTEDKNLFSTEVIMDWFLKFCDAINYIHSRQIVHRDLKPDNIFVFQDKKTNEIHLKIGDFGVSRVLDSTIHAKTIAGTPLYMAPEQISQGLYTIKVDVWALGVILFQASMKLKNLKILLGAQTEDHLQKIFGNVEDPSIRMIVSTILRISPEERPTISSLLSSPLIAGWNRLLYDKDMKPSSHPHSAIAFISGLSSPNMDFVAKSLKLLKEEFYIGVIHTIVRDYQGVPALLNLCGESVSESIRESALDFLFQYSELGRKNQDSLRRWNAINILWKLLLARVSTRSVLRLIISMCKFNTPNQKSFEAAGIFPIIKAFLLPQALSTYSTLVSDILWAFRHFNDVEKIKPAMQILSSNSNTLIKFSYMRDVATLMELGAVPLLVQTIPKYPEALKVLRYAIEDVSDCLNATSVHGVCSFAITEYCPYPMDYYYCLSCWRDMEKACCMTCARLCHKGHELVWTVAESGFICDCWSHSCCARKSKDTKFEFLTIKQTNRQSISLLPYNSEKIQEAEPGTLECMTPFEFTSVQVNRPWKASINEMDETGNSTVAYCEVQILEGGCANEIGIGLAPLNFKPNTMPGCEPDSIGYHGDDGSKYCGQLEGSRYGPHYSTGDFIGLGLTSYGEVYYTKNGFYLGVAYSVKRNSPYYVTIGMRGVGTKVKLNFGQTSFRFHFDLISLITPNSYSTMKNKQVQEAVRNSGGLELLINSLRDKDDKIILAAFSVIIAAVDQNEESAETCSLILSESSILDALRYSTNTMIQIKINIISEMLAKPGKTTIIPLIPTPKSVRSSRASIPPVSIQNVRDEGKLDADISTTPRSDIDDITLQLSELEKQLSLVSSMEDDDDTPKFKLRVNVKLLGEDRGRLEVCTSPSETFGQFLARLKRKRTELQPYNLVLSDTLDSEFALQDKLCDLLDDKDTVVLSKKFV